MLSDPGAAVHGQSEPSHTWQREPLSMSASRLEPRANGVTLELKVRRGEERSGVSPGVGTRSRRSRGARARVGVRLPDRSWTRPPVNGNGRSRAMERRRFLELVLASGASAALGSTGRAAVQGDAPRIAFTFDDFNV